MIRIARLTAAFLVVAAAMGATPSSATAADDSGGRMMLVLDSSGSMKEKAGGGATKIDAAKEALDQVIDGLPAKQDVGLRVYGAKVYSRDDKGACTDSQRVVDLASDNRAELKKAIAGYKPWGETPTGYALEQAGKDLGNEGKRTIVLVSDGESTCDPDPCKAAAKLAASGVDLRIDVVGLDVTGKARDQLQCVAGSGNGTYYDAQDADDLSSALDTLATRAARPYESIGRKITGAQSTKGAPRITAGDWRDTIGGAGSDKRVLYYRLSGFATTSTLHISASIMQPAAGNDAIHVDVVKAGNIASQDSNDLCVQDSALQLGDRQVGLLSAAVSWKQDPEAVRYPLCKAPDLYVRVMRGQGNGDFKNAGNNDLPVEIRIIEEPAIVKGQALPNKDDNSVFEVPAKADARTALTSGSSFADAPTIKPGAYTDTIVPGETQIFLVDVDWGQRLQSQLALPDLTGQLAKVVGPLGPSVSVQIYSPARALATSLIPNTSDGDLANDHAQLGNRFQSLAQSMTEVVRYNNRDFLGGSFVRNDTAAALAGKYAVVIHTDNDPSSNVSYQVPVDLDIQVLGETSGTPKYTTEPKEIGATPAGKPATTKGDSGLPVLPIGLGIAGIAAIAGAALLFGRSRRSTEGR